MLCRVTHSGIRWSMRIQRPAMSAYQVCAWATWASTGSRAIASAIESVSSGRVERLVAPGADPVPRRVAAQRDAIGRLGRGALTEAADLHRHEPAERLRELPDDDSRATVDVRRIFAGQEEGFHERSVPSA